MTIRVLTVLDSLGGGGIETTLLRCLPGLQREGIALDVCVHRRGGALESEFLRHGVQVAAIRSTANIHQNAKDIRRMVDEWQTDVIHTRMGYRAGGPVIAGRRAGRPVVVSLHSTDPGLDGWKREAWRRTLRAWWLSANRAIVDRATVTVLGHSIANLDAYDPYWRDGLPGRYRHVPNGVIDRGASKWNESHDPVLLRQRLGIPTQRTPVLCCVGGMRPGKNQEYLVSLLPRIRKRWPEVLLLLVGDGERRSVVLAAAAELGDTVHCVGFQPDSVSYMRAADMVVSPSLHEGLGNALIEAQAVGTPVIASAIPAHCEALAPVYHMDMLTLDDPDGDADKILARLATPKAVRDAMAAQAQQYVHTHFMLSRMVEDLVSVYRESALTMAGPR